MKFTPLGKAVIFILVLGLGLGAWRFWNKIAPAAETQQAVIPNKAELPTNAETTQPMTSTAKYVAPGSEPGCTDRPEVRILGYAWNAQMGELLAIGGAQSTSGSLMCRHGVNLKFTRQDDNGKMQEALVAFATELSQGNSNPGKGAHFVTIMGDGAASFLAGVNPNLRRLGPEYQAKIVDSAGYSHGEDKLMGPPEWRSNPSASQGSLVAGVVRDGDWNIAQKWLGDNSLRTNPDEKTYDPDAMNWVNASDYIDAAQKYVAGYSETRPVVRNGHRTGEQKTITVNGCVTWTPGDVTVAQKKGGLVSVVSTREYSSQMPCVIIGIDKWMKANRATVDGMIEAIAEGGDQVKSDPDALHKAAEISDQVYHEPGTGADYWEKYYKGTREQDKTGQTVDLGGSQASNLADSLLAFGLVAHSANLVAATYRVFGDIDVQQFPNLVPTYPPSDDVIDTSYLQDVAKKVAPPAEEIAARAPTYEHVKPGVQISPQSVISRKSWNIHFNPSQSSFTPEARQQLEQLSRQLLVASGAVVEVHGHTDNQGNPNTSRGLSERRAFAVKDWLQRRYPVNFPEGRIRVFAHGESEPIAPNSTPEGRARNRRVEIVIGTSGA